MSPRHPAHKPFSPSGNYVVGTGKGRDAHGKPQPPALWEPQAHSPFQPPHGSLGPPHSLREGNPVSGQPGLGLGEGVCVTARFPATQKSPPGLVLAKLNSHTADLTP